MTIFRMCAALGRRFGMDSRGQIAIIFALASVAIFAGLGAGIDLARAYAARQKLSQVATLACQYSTRPSVAQTATANYSGANGFQTYVNAINAFATSSLGNQNWGTTPTTGGSGSAGQYFTATPAVGGSTAAANSPTNPVVEMSANVPTSFAGILHVNSIAVHARIGCSTLAATPQVVNPPLILKEGFEQPCTTGAFCQYGANGSSSISVIPTQTFPANPSYVGFNGFSWYVVGYCLEQDLVGVINPNVPEGSYAAELDCGNSAGGQTAGNSSISAIKYLSAGQYELRYFYRSRVDYPDYDPAYVCGSTANDLSWANDNNATNGNGLYGVTRTNQINVYLDLNIAGTNGVIGSPPLHTTLDGLQHLAGANLIDECVYAQNWTERSIKIKVTTPGSYWLTFAADGQNDSYGGQIDDIRLCQEKCATPLQDNYPAVWIGAKLFEDTFDNPGYLATSPYSMSVLGNPWASKGTSGTSASGWPSKPSEGWYAAPVNQVAYGTTGAYQGSQYISLDDNGLTGGNRLISRPFVLDPGYYKVTYNYVSTINLYPYVTVNYCASAPPGGPIYPTTAGITAPGTIKNGTASPVTVNVDTNIVGVFMASETTASHPNGALIQGLPTTYTNPDGSITATPTVPPDTVNYQYYTLSTTSALIDTCGFTLGWYPRTVYVKITKPGRYWLTFSSQGSTADNYGGAIDDVTVTGVGSPYMSGAPTTALATVPVLAPQHDTLFTPSTFDGFSFVAAPFQPPAADQ